MFAMLLICLTILVFLSTCSSYVHKMDGSPCTRPRVSTEEAKELIVDLQMVQCDEDYPYRSYDGTCNNVYKNLANEGSTNRELLRYAKADYADNKHSPSGKDRPSPRSISEALFDQTSSVPNSKRMSGFLWQWGQFIDHDLILTLEDEEDHGFGFEVENDDACFAGRGTTIDGSDKKFISVHRSVSVSSENQVREQMNAITGFLDGSMVYGSDMTTAESLRDSVNRMKMKVSDENFLPVDSNDMFMAGDIRVNEQPGLTMMHTLFVLEHNRQADIIHKNYPNLLDEEVFQMSRKVVSGKIQKITFENYFFAMTGFDLPVFEGYDRQGIPGVMNEFSTVTFRLGHSMVTDKYTLMKDGTTTTVSLSDSFFMSASVIKSYDNAMADVAKSLHSLEAQQVDTKVISELQCNLFKNNAMSGKDLVALNIQRGRDHGMPSYTELRKAFGGGKIRHFSDITNNVELQDKLKEIYGEVENIDAFVGVIAEDIDQGIVGRTNSLIMLKQFSRLRDFDRFYYKSDQILKLDDYKMLLEDIEGSSLGKLMSDNFGLEDMANVDVFHIPEDNNRRSLRSA